MTAVSTTGLPVVAIFGTSISEGFIGEHRESYIQQALQSAGLPFIGLGKGSERIAYLTELTHHRARYPLAAAATDVICEHGVNDGLNSGATTFAGLAGALLGLWGQLVALAAAPRIWQCTLPPSYNTSTDAWVTTVNQTAPPGNTARVQVNDWIRAGAPLVGAAPVAAGTAGSTPSPLLTGYFDAADAMESARNTGLWKVNGAANYYTADGTHPSIAAHAAAASIVNTAAILAAYLAARPTYLPRLLTLGGTAVKVG